MPWSGGVYTRGYPSWVNDANNNLPISATKFDTEDNDFAAGLNNCATIDGLNQMTASFVPKATNSYALGSPSFTWSALYVQAANLTGSGFVPTADNTYPIGSNSKAWSNLYLGANHAPLLDTVSGNVGYYAQTAAEIAASVTPTNYAYPAGDVRRYGAVTTDLTGATNTPAFQNALKSTAPVYVPSGVWYINNALNCTVKGQKIYGDGRYVSIIHCPSTFNLAAVGVFNFNTGEEGPQIYDLWIDADQSATASSGNRASLVAYPPAIFAWNQARFTAQRIRIAGFLYGIDMRGNAGGCFLSDIEMGCFTIGIQLDGSLDYNHIENWHSWTFGDFQSGAGAMTANQQAIYNDGTNVGLSSGRCDGLGLINCDWINAGTQTNFFAGTGGGHGWQTGPTFGWMTNCNWDSYGGLTVSAGQLQIANAQFSEGLITSSFLVNASTTANYTTDLQFDNCEFSNGGATGTLITLTSNTANALLWVKIRGSTFQNLHDVTDVLMTGSQPCKFILDSNWHYHLNSGTASNPVVKTTGVGPDLTFTNNQAFGQASGSSTFLSIGTDTNNVIANNDFGLRGLILPSPYSSTLIGLNHNVTNPVTTTWSLDRANDTVTIANGANAALPNGSGLIVVTEYTGGQSALYICGGGGCALVSGANNWVASTTTPAAGKLSVAFSGSAYAIYNNQGASEIVGVFSLRTRPNT